MWIIHLILFGLAVGVLARLLHPGEDKMNLLWTILLGVWGSILGGWAGSWFGINVEEGWRRWLAATLGAILLLLLYGLVRGRTPQDPTDRPERRFSPFRRRPS